MFFLSSSIIILIAITFCVNTAYNLHAKTAVSVLQVSGGISRIKLNARVARRDDEVRKENSNLDDTISIPVAGLAGYEPGKIFKKPLEIFDPTKDTDSLPGADGSDEKISAIQRRIQNRVEELKKSGEWDNDVEGFGKDPLANQEIWKTMLMQVKACKPYESYDELALTYILVLIATFALTSYLLGIRELQDNFMDWFIKTDFNFFQ
jgi:hypothetical protein